MPEQIPTAADAGRIVTHVMGTQAEAITRFPTGMAHYVFDVRLVDGRACVVRLTRPAWKKAFTGAVYWSQRLRSLGVPLPELFYADADGRQQGYPTLIMERLPGTDLGDAYPALSSSQKQALAHQIVEVQRQVGRQPLGPGFGYATSCDDPVLKRSWSAFLEAHLMRSRQWLRAAGLVDPVIVDRVQRRLAAHDAYLAAVMPMPFLDDATTKNVIVMDGQLSGIVDVDVLCFGDPMRTPALTRTALLSVGYDTVYIDAWLAALDATPEQHAIVDLYSAMYGVAFLAELGQSFNRDAPQPVDSQRFQRLLTLVDDFLARG